MNIKTCRTAVALNLLWLATMGCQVEDQADGVAGSDAARATAVLAAGPNAAVSQFALPDVEIRSDLELGTFPESWRTGGPNCTDMPRWQVHAYNPDFYILRQSGCVHYEKPFLYLIFGEERALLEDTGAGDADTAALVLPLVEQWSERNGKDSTVPLTVVHSHSHGDHVAGDRGFDNLPGVAVVAAAVGDIQVAFGIENWPSDTGQIDLGDRVLDVIPIPGHDGASIALYDRATGVLLTGDSLYPGRLYVGYNNFRTFVESNQRLVDFTRDRPVAHILGTHIEQTRTPFVDYPRGTRYQPDEHTLEMSRGLLLELNGALIDLNGRPEEVALRDLTLFPIR
jgi:hydroxyacylglutathione hydrolase